MNKKLIGLCFLLVYAAVVINAQAIQITTPLDGKTFRAGTELKIEWKYLQERLVKLKRVSSRKAYKVPTLTISLLNHDKLQCVIAQKIPLKETSFVWSVNTCSRSKKVSKVGAKYSMMIQRSDSVAKYTSKGYFNIITKPLILLAKIKDLEVIYNDCQMDFKLKGENFGPVQGHRCVKLESGPYTYQATISSWSSTEIYCYLQGDVKLGRKYRVSIRNSINNNLVSNYWYWLLKTKIKLGAGTYAPGQNIAISGCLLGTSQGGKKLIIGPGDWDVVSWDCEDIVFNVPQLAAGDYKLYLKEGTIILSNIIQITIQ